MVAQAVWCSGEKVFPVIFPIISLEWSIPREQKLAKPKCPAQGSCTQSSQALLQALRVVVQPSCGTGKGNRAAEKLFKKPPKPASSIVSGNGSEPASEFEFVIPKQLQPELSVRQNELKYGKNAAVPSASFWPKSWSCCFGMRQERRNLGRGMEKMQLCRALCQKEAKAREFHL